MKYNEVKRSRQLRYNSNLLNRFEALWKPAECHKMTNFYNYQ